MTREKAKELYPIMKAYSEGAGIEILDVPDNKWVYVKKPVFTVFDKYRIKPSDKPRTIEDGLVEGDVIFYWSNEKKVLGVCGKVIFTSVSHNFKETNDYQTLDQLIKYGYKLKQEPVETPITEITLEEIAKLKGVPVEQIRVKKEE